MKIRTMKIRKPIAALLAGLGLLGAGAVTAAPAAKAQPAPRYVYFTLYNNLISRLSPRPDLLETRIDPDLRRAPVREALRTICARAGQEYVIEGRLAEEKRITVQGKGLMLAEALDQLVRQAGGGWMQAMKNGKPVIRIGRDVSFMTGHIGPIVLPRDQPFLDQVEKLRRAQPPSEPTDSEIRQMSLSQAAASGRGVNLLGRRGIPSVTVP